MLKISCFDDILLAVTKVPEPEKKLVQEVQTIYWLLAVNAATYAAGERSFWLRFRMARSRMDDERFSSLCLSRLSVIRVISMSKRKLKGVLEGGKAPSRLPKTPLNFPSLASLAITRLLAVMIESLEQAIEA